MCFANGHHWKNVTYQNFPTQVCLSLSLEFLEKFHENHEHQKIRVIIGEKYNIKKGKPRKTNK